MIKNLPPCKDYGLLIYLFIFGTTSHLQDLTHDSGFLLLYVFRREHILLSIFVEGRVK